MKTRLADKFSLLDIKHRFYQLDIPIIGLTGGIATGKSTVSEMLKKKGYAVICADQLIKSIYQQQATIDFIASIAPKAVSDNKIDFTKLRQWAFNSNQHKETLEKFLYPGLEIKFQQALSEIKKSQGEIDFIIYDIPLLFEKKMQSLFDLVICVYANEKIQASRVMARDHVSQEQAENILKYQMPIEQKKLMAEVVLLNEGSLDELVGEVQALIDTCFV